MHMQSYDLYYITVVLYRHILMRLKKKNTHSEPVLRTCEVEM